MRRRSRWCERSGRRRSRPRSCPPATTARRCWRPPGYRRCSTRGWTGRISPAWGSRASRRPTRSWRRRGASGSEPSRAVVVEDAIAGVEAGHAGRFGCVIGVDRSGQSQALREAGADVVVTDLAQVQVAVEPPSAWSLVYEDFDPAREGMREALCALGNGYFATRGAAAWARADGVHYPGTYLAGGYNRLHTDIAGRVVENEDLVNLPQLARPRVSHRGWGLVRRAERQDPVLPPGARSPARHAVADYHASRTVGGGAARSRSGAWSRWRDMHLGALELTLTAENWSGQRRRPLGHRRAGRQRGRQALSQVQQSTPGAAGGRSRRRGRRLSAGAHLPVESSRRAGGTNAGVRQRANSSDAPRRLARRAGLHRAGVRRRSSSRARR